jgi:hypothetical protein
MAARRQAAPRPVEGALIRLMALAARGAGPSRMAREVGVIVDAWLAGADPEALGELRERLAELRDQLAEGVAAAEEQVEAVDRSEAAALRQAMASLAAMSATRDAAAEALAGLAERARRVAA